MARSARSRISSSSVLATACVVAAGAIAWSGMANARSSTPPAAQVTLAGTPRGQGAAGAVAYPSISRGGLPSRIVIPAANVDAPVTEVGVVVEDGVPRWETAWRAAGHHIDSALPGQPGNMVITGHVSVADRRNLAVFASLDAVAPGDAIEVYSGASRYAYIVRDVLVVEPEAVHVLRSDSAATVTLITCTRDLEHRLVVVGVLADIESGQADA
jgi:LPXTG-site transpeptidase (sortase) family protein